MNRYYIVQLLGSGGWSNGPYPPMDLRDAKSLADAYRDTNRVSARVVDHRRRVVHSAPFRPRRRYG